MGRACVLHVGTEKTGSTSIQRFLGLNRASLRSEGVYVPRSLSPSAGDGIFNHIGLSVLGRPDDSELDDIDSLVGLHQKCDRAAFSALCMEDLRAELAMAANSKKFILSSEHIHSRVFPAGGIGKLRSILDAHFDEVAVVLYIRDQYEMHRSKVSTALRAGYAADHRIPEIAENDDYWKYFDLISLVEELSTHFGRTNLRLRLFPEGRSTSHLLTDFCDAAELTLRKPVHPPRENPSFSPTATQLFEKINESCSGRRQNASEVIRHFGDYLTTAHVGRGVDATPAEIAAFRARFARDNERIREEWFPHRTQLFEPREPFPVTDPAPDRDDAINLLIDYIAWRENRAQEVFHSASWRVTAPLRALKRHLGAITAPSSRASLH